MEKIFLLPGDLAAVNKPSILATLLGSCVSVCLDNPYRGIAAMNHYMLPYHEGGTGAGGRYGDTAIREIFRRVFALDPDPKHYRARIYGGGAVVGHLNPSGNLAGIGDRNIIVAREELSRAGVQLAGEDVGGTRGRRLEFNTETSQIDCRQVGTDNAAQPRSVGVLIVDDSRMVRRVVRSSLEGYEGLRIVGEATHPFEAREKILTCNPDVITLDIEMPRMDGLTFLKNLMAHFPKPVVVMSSLAKRGSSVEVAARQCGAWGVFDKEQLELFKGVQALQQLLAPVLLEAARANQR